MLFLPRRRSRFLTALIQKQKLSFTALLIISSLLGIVLPLFAYEISSVLGEITILKDFAGNHITPGLFYILILGVISVVLHHLHNIVSAYYLPMLANNCRELSFSQILSNGYQFFKKNPAFQISDIINKLAINTVSASKWLYFLTMSTFAVLAIIVILIAINKYLATMFIVWWIILTIACVTASNFICKLSYLANISSTTFYNQANDTIANYIEVRLGNKIDQEDNLIKKNNAEICQSYKNIGLLFSNLEFVCSTLSIGVIIILVTNSILLWQDGDIILKDLIFIASTSIFIYLLPAAYLRGCNAIRSNSITIKECLRYLTNVNSTSEHAKAQDIKISKGKIEFKKVTLKYQQNDNVFKDKTLTIQAGQKIALVGLSGSGKTTFSHMVPRLIKATSGRIFIDGQDISKVSLKSLNSCITILEQEPRLFRRSIRDNISYGVESASEEDIVDAAIKACCHDSIMNLDKGYDTIVGERGSKLTQGQKYRILIARAILKDSAIIIIDEPDFDLDAISAKQIKDALGYLFTKKTVIIIAHWLETLKKADRILVFSKGTIVEDGSHQELLRYDEVYASLWYMQDGGYLPGTFDK